MRSFLDAWQILVAAGAACSLAFAACAHGETFGAGGAEAAGTEAATTTGTGPGSGSASATGATSAASSSSGSEHCGTAVGPDVSACCTACTKAGKPCQANGCYNGYWCKTTTCGCESPPSPSTCGG